MSTYFYYVIPLVSPTEELLPPVLEALLAENTGKAEYFEVGKTIRLADGTFTAEFSSDGYMGLKWADGILQEASARGVSSSFFAHTTDGESFAQLVRFGHGKGCAVYSGSYVDGIEQAETIAAAEAGDERAQSAVAAFFADGYDPEGGDGLSTLCTFADTIIAKDINPTPEQVGGWLDKLNAVRRVIDEDGFDPYDDGDDTLQRIQSRAEAVRLAARAKGKGGGGGGGRSPL